MWFIFFFLRVPASLLRVERTVLTDRARFAGTTRTKEGLTGVQKRLTAILLETSAIEWRPAIITAKENEKPALSFKV